ncbi:hypothetical protein SDC9_54711 [bioreactor metagenome]|uniref:TPM domain-containing protein n=1 Tax=bioreactor metagenome TaxID=1076179 RepID=A0A644WX74_9ZZZZ
MKRHGLRFFVLLLIPTMMVSCGSRSNSSDNDFEVVADTLANKAVPEMKGVVTDYEKLFTQGEAKTLISRCEAFEKDNAVPVGVFTSENIGEFNNFTEYADAVSEKWNGCKENQGLLFVISNKLGEIRMISCPATEGRISDNDFDYVINTVIFDEFRKNQFADGILKALDYLGQKIKKQ